MGSKRKPTRDGGTVLRIAWASTGPVAQTDDADGERLKRVRKIFGLA